MNTSKMIIVILICRQIRQFAIKLSEWGDIKTSIKMCKTNHFHSLSMLIHIAQIEHNLGAVQFVSGWLLYLNSRVM